MLQHVDISMCNPCMLLGVSALSERHIISSVDIGGECSDPLHMVGGPERLDVHIQGAGTFEVGPVAAATLATCFSNMACRLAYSLLGTYVTCPNMRPNRW